MTIEEAFKATGYFFEGLLEKDADLRKLFHDALAAGNKPYMWQGLNSLPRNILMMTVAPTPPV